MLTEKQCEAALRYNERRNYAASTIEQLRTLLQITPKDIWDIDAIQSVAGWQKANRLLVDGKVGPSTLQAMRETAGDRAGNYPVMHPLPTITSMWGYDHCPNTYKKPCPAWHDATKEPTFVNGLLRLVSGGTEDRDRFSRSPDSWISLDEFSIGIAHWWADTAPGILSAIARVCPGPAAVAWGATAAAMQNEEWLRKQVRAKRGKRHHQSRYDWLLSGWWEIGQHPDVVRLCAARWLQDYTPAGIAIMKVQRWRRADTLAGLIRVTNSRGVAGMQRLLKKALAAADSRDENQVMPVLFSKEIYGHPDRWKIVQSMPHFEGKAPEQVSLEGFHFNRDLVVRVDGSTPGWLAGGI